MNTMSPVTRASATVVCAIAVVGAASASASAPSKVLPRGAKVVANIAIPPETGGMAVGEGAVWAMSWSASRLTRIDPVDNTVAARITVKPVKPCPPAPDPCGELAVGNGAVWVSLTTDGAVARIDPETNRVTATIPVGPEPGGLASSPGAIWVAHPGSTVTDAPSVSRIDPATNQIVATIKVGPGTACCSDRMGVYFGGGAVWAAVPNLGAVVRIDPTTNKVTATIKLAFRRQGQPCGFVAAGKADVWVASAHCPASSGTGVVTRIDPRTNRTAETVTDFVAPIGLAVAFGSVWVADLDTKSIDRISPRSRRVVARLRVGGLPIRLAVGFGSLWVRDDSGRVLRIKPQGAPA
jgi:YVTN family beta-propeller protein